MACLAPGGCHIGSIVSNRLPNVNDDACDTNDNGEYLCVGSYWIFDPTLDGADPLLGRCERVFTQLSDECNMAEWFELAVPTIVSDTVDPVDGDDCCPPGSLWHNTVSDSYFISLNDGTCRWCEICAPAFEDVHTSHHETEPEQLTIYEDDAGTLPGVDTDNINVQVLSFTNPSAVRSMAVCANWGGINADFSFLDDDGAFNARYALQPQFSFRIDAAPFAVLNDRFQSDVYYAHFKGLGGDLGTTTEFNMGSGGWSHCVTLPPGSTVEFRQEVFLNILTQSTASENTRLSVYSLPITALGSTI